MKLEELQTCKCTSQVNIPFSTCWSDDNYIAMATEKGVYTTGGRWRWKSKNLMGWNFLVMMTICLLCSVNGGVSATDFTSTVFGGATSGIPAAFGDFNSDEYPDLFIIDSKDSRKIQILLGGDGEPLIKKSPSGNGLKCTMKYPVTSLVPGDFDGDAIMDVLVTMSRPDVSAGCSETQEVRVLWGNGDSLMCNSSFEKPLLMCGQPLAMDYNMDMIIDLFGEWNSKRTFWVFGDERKYPTVHEMTINTKSPTAVSKPLNPLRIPHSHAFLDLSSDYSPDMFVTTTAGFEIWLKDPETQEGFVYSDETWAFPEGVKHAGQSIFLDTELKGKLDHIFPACHDVQCTNSSLYVRLNDKWLPLKINFHDKTNGVWGFIPPKPSSIIQNVISLHGGDYNMDGFPDLLATLRSGSTGKVKTFLLKNEQCLEDCAEYSRTFTIAWDELSPANNDTQLGVFYDFMQDGILDIIFVKNGSITAFKNNLDYDANFIKVMVITGIKEHPVPAIPNPAGRKNRTYGTNLPGPLISYNSTDQNDEPRASVSPQLPQSAYMCLHLPYTLFGLGRTPNFVDKLTVGIYNKTRYWTQIIPNSQMVVIPIPLQDPTHWTARLFVTPSKLIVKSFIALLGTCLLLTLIIAVLWWRERREDHQERRQESHRFHYDGM